MNFESKECSGSLQDMQLKNEQPVPSDSMKLNPQNVTSVPVRSPPQAAQPIVSFQEKMSSNSSASRKKSVPNVSTKRKPRKLAVNFGASKSLE